MAGGTPRFAALSDADVAALYGYVIDSAWDAHEGRAGRSVSLRAR